MNGIEEIGRQGGAKNKEHRIELKDQQLISLLDTRYLILDT